MERGNGEGKGKRVDGGGGGGGRIGAQGELTTVSTTNEVSGDERGRRWMDEGIERSSQWLERGVIR